MQTIYNLKMFMTKSLVIVAAFCFLTSSTEALSCNYEGKIYNICLKTNTNWSYENSAVCVGITRCVSQSPPYGVVPTPTSSTPTVTPKPTNTTPLPTTTTPLPTTTTPLPTTTTPLPTTTTPKPTPAPPVHGQNLPIIFFHGVFGDPSAGNSLKARLSGRTWIGLDFCTGSCSVGEMNKQVQAAISQVRQKTQGNSAFAKGYIFIAHSMGSILARGVIEEMDDHKVKSFISLAGVANGIFYGPQQADATALTTYLGGMGAAVLPGFDFSKYSSNDKNGKFQYELNQATNSNDSLQQTAGAQVLYSPAPSPWNVKNKFVPVLNNINPCSTSSCTADQARRKANFLRLSEAHFFGSNADGVVAPWQTSILGKYSDVSTNEEIQSKFSSLTVVDVKNTREYTEDTYGLKTLDARGGLHTTAVNGIGHGNWLSDTNIYNQYLAPIL